MVDFAALRNRAPKPTPTVPRLCVGITGHRPDKLGGYDSNNPLRVKIRERIKLELLDFVESKVSSQFDAHYRDSFLRQITWRTQRPTDLLAFSGLAQGTDWDFCTVCYQLKIPFVGVIPFPGQDSRWPKATQQAYQKLLEHCAGIVYVSAESPKDDIDAAKQMLHKRNEWLCCAIDELIAVYDGSPGGTSSTVRYWSRLGGSRLRRIDPREL